MYAEYFLIYIPMFKIKKEPLKYNIGYIYVGSLLFGK